ncbi:MAG: LppM family (lipo)protein [Acidimicrobiales bacterium]
MTVEYNVNVAASVLDEAGISDGEFSAELEAAAAAEGMTFRNDPHAANVGAFLSRQFGDREEFNATSGGMTLAPDGDRFVLAGRLPRAGQLGLDALDSSALDVLVAFTFPGSVVDTNGIEYGKDAQWEYLSYNDRPDLYASAYSNDDGPPPLVFVAGRVGLALVAVAVAVIAIVANSVSADQRRTSVTLLSRPAEGATSQPTSPADPAPAQPGKVTASTWAAIVCGCALPVLTYLVSWSAVGDQSTSDGWLSIGWIHPEFTRLVETVVVATSCLLLVPVVAVLASLATRDRLVRPWPGVLGLATAYAAWMAFIGRVLSADVYGANIGGGLLLLLHVPLTVALLALVLWLVFPVVSRVRRNLGELRAATGPAPPGEEHDRG